MANENRKNIPGNTNDIEIKIKDLDYTNDLTRLSIISSLASPYPFFEFVLNLDSEDIILDGVFGEDPIKLFLRTIGEDGQIIEEINISLILLDTNHPINIKEESLDNKIQKERINFKFMAIPIDSFKTITTNINKIYLNKTITEIFQDLISTYTDAKLKLDKEGINNDNIEQVIIPPTTLYRVIKEKGENGKIDGYLDSQFGIYDGIPAIYCNYKNELKIMNLSKQMKKSSTMKITHLSRGSNSEEIYDKSIEDGDLYTFTPIKTSYLGNSKFSVISNDINYIIKPTDKLYHIISKNLDDVISKYGLVDKNKKVQKNQNAITQRKKYNIDYTGNEYSEVFANTDISSLIGSLSSIELSVFGSFYTENLMNIGSVVKFDPSGIEEIDIEGKYILYSTYIKYSRDSTQWKKESNLRLVRSNKTN